MLISDFFGNILRKNSAEKIFDPHTGTLEYYRGDLLIIKNVKITNLKSSEFQTGSIKVSISNAQKKEVAKLQTSTKKVEVKNTNGPGDLGWNSTYIFSIDQPHSKSFLLKIEVYLKRVGAGLLSIQKNIYTFFNQFDINGKRVMVEESIPDIGNISFYYVYSSKLNRREWYARLKDNIFVNIFSYLSLHDLSIAYRIKKFHIILSKNSDVVIQREGDIIRILKWLTVKVPSKTRMDFTLIPLSAMLKHPSIEIANTTKREIFRHFYYFKQKKNFGNVVNLIYDTLSYNDNKKFKLNFLFIFKIFCNFPNLVREKKNIFSKMDSLFSNLVEFLEKKRIYVLNDKENHDILAMSLRIFHYLSFQVDFRKFLKVNSKKNVNDDMKQRFRKCIDSFFQVVIFFVKTPRVKSVTLLRTVLLFINNFLSESFNPKMKSFMILVKHLCQTEEGGNLINILIEQQVKVPNILLIMSQYVSIHQGKDIYKIFQHVSKNLNWESNKTTERVVLINLTKYIRVKGIKKIDSEVLVFLTHLKLFVKRIMVEKEKNIKSDLYILSTELFKIYLEDEETDLAIRGIISEIMSDLFEFVNMKMFFLKCNNDRVKLSNFEKKIEEKDSDLRNIRQEIEIMVGQMKEELILEVSKKMNSMKVEVIKTMKNDLTLKGQDQMKFFKRQFESQKKTNVKVINELVARKSRAMEIRIEKKYFGKAKK